MTRRLAAATGVLLAAAPGAAVACPVCFDANSQSIWFYQLSTTMLSLLPFGIIGGVALVAWRLARQSSGAGAPPELGDPTPR
jgi:hypothetical protein